MSQISDQLDQFREFALSKITTSGNRLTLDELFDEWRLTYPDPHQQADDAQAVLASLNDYRNGVGGTSPAEILARIRSKVSEE
jgi:hypothetical protein